VYTCVATWRCRSDWGAVVKRVEGAGDVGQRLGVVPADAHDSTGTILGLKAGVTFM
jgi:hypothetical protein